MKWELGRLDLESNLSGLQIDSDVYDSISENYNEFLLETKKQSYTDTVMHCAKDQGAFV